jgi:hypothetical protein
LIEDYRAVFVEQWPSTVGAVLIVMVVMALMASGLFWGVFGGLKLWGDYLNSWLGLGPLLGLPEVLENPLLHRISIMNIVLVLGAFSAALLSGQFRINRPPPVELLWGAVGGTWPAAAPSAVSSLPCCSRLLRAGRCWPACSQVRRRA